MPVLERVVAVIGADRGAAVEERTAGGLPTAGDSGGLLPSLNGGRESALEVGESWFLLIPQVNSLIWVPYLGIFVPDAILKVADGMVYDRYTVNKCILVIFGSATFTGLFGVAPELVLEGALAAGRSTAFAASASGLVAAASVSVIYAVSVLAFGIGNATHFPVLIQASFVITVVLAVAGGISHALHKPRTS